MKQLVTEKLREYCSSNYNPFSIDYQMAVILFDILRSKNNLQMNRTGIPTYKTDSVQFRFENFPRIYGKYVNPRLAFTELLWMLSGRTDIEWLNQRKLNYWNSWKDENGTIGKSYGYQFGKQIESVVEGLKSDWNSRRHIINLWKFDDLPEMVLPPCVYCYQWVTYPNKAVLIVNCRSCDVFLGGPYDFMFAYFLNYLVMQYVRPDLENMEIIFNIADCHIYENQLPSILKYAENLLDNNNSEILSATTDFEMLVDNSLPFSQYVQTYIDILDACLDNRLDWFSFCRTSVDESKFLRINTPVAI